MQLVLDALGDLVEEPSLDSGILKWGRLPFLTGALPLVEKKKRICAPCSEPHGLLPPRTILPACHGMAR